MNTTEKTNSHTSHVTSHTGPDDKGGALIGVYQEICKSHQAIDDFRMKLLGLLPLTSLTGIFVLSKTDSLFASSNAGNSISPNALVAFIGIFAAAFTLALFLYEIRGILRCSDLIISGRRIEQHLGVFGQFSVCHHEHKHGKRKSKHTIFNAKLAACVIYSVVFAAWLFLALHRGFGFRIQYCTATALTSGLLIAVSVYLLISRQIAA